VSETAPTPPGPSRPTERLFRSVASRFATGLTVVTTVADGVDHAMTANSFTSVSLDPLLVLVCVERNTRFHDAVLTSGAWAVSVLDEDAEATAVWFATKGRPLAGQLDRVGHRPGPATGCALLDDALAWLECATWRTYPGGDHTIVVGEVLGAQQRPDPVPGPLVYHRRRYHRLGPA